MKPDLLRHKETLIQLAHSSIEHGVKYGKKREIDLAKYDDCLRINSATFVTLHLHNALRGCVGQLEASRPLVIDVAMNAYAAAFQDPRFAPLNAMELPLITLCISVLSEPECIEVSNEEALYQALRPGIDGLIIQKGLRRGTYLPSVWEQLPKPEDFVRYLKRKIGIAEKDNSKDIQYFRYKTVAIDEAE
jgi:hypothetical protein